MSIQSQFLKFNKSIRVDFETNKELSEKRDILVKKLENSKELPKFETFNQGSYAMHTGVKPNKNKEYDIDVALLFEVEKADQDPLALKKKICSILEKHTDLGAEIKDPCVTVTYKKSGEAAFHVDFAVYAYEDRQRKQGKLYLANGKTSSSQSWLLANPKGLVKYIKSKIGGEEESDQFRRVVRYIKHWKNRRFSSSQKHANPPSIGITLIALEEFSYYEDDDLKALINVLENLRSRFLLKNVGKDQKEYYSITYYLPCFLHFDRENNVFRKMSLIQMTDFKEKVDKLYEDLQKVVCEVDEFQKFKQLNKIFGDEFEVPEEDKTAKKQINYLPSSSASGLI